jgi:hypothetical protein
MNNNVARWRAACKTSCGEGWRDIAHAGLDGAGGRVGAVAAPTLFVLLYACGGGSFATNSESCNADGLAAFRT